MLKIQSNYAVIASEYGELLNNMVTSEKSLLVIGEPVSFESFKLNVDQVIRNSNYIDKIIFDITYLKTEEDFFKALQYLKSNADIKTIVIAPFLNKKRQFERLLNLGIFDIVSLRDSEVELNNEEDVKKEISYLLQYLDNNPRDFGQAYRYFESIPESTNEDTDLNSNKKGKTNGFGLLNFIKNKTENLNSKKENKEPKGEKEDKPSEDKKSKEIRKKPVKKKYKISLMTNDLEFGGRIRERLGESPFELIDVIDYKPSLDIQAILFHGDYELDSLSTICENLTDKNKIIIYKNNLITEDYEEIFKINDEISEESLLKELEKIINKKPEKKKKEKPKKEKKEKAKKERKPINLSFLKIPLLIISLLGLGFGSYYFLNNTDFGKNILSKIQSIMDQNGKIQLKSKEIVISYKESSYEYLNNLKNKSTDAYIINVNNEEVKLGEIGEYNVIYTLIKDGETIDTKTVKVKVVDDVTPTLTLSTEEITINEDDEFSCKEYIVEAIDEIDGNLKENVICSTYNKTLNEQFINYEVSDSSKNVTKNKIKLNIILKSTTPTSSEAETTTIPETTTEAIKPSETEKPAVAIFVEVEDMELKVGASQADIELLVTKSLKKKQGSGDFYVSINYSAVDTTKEGEYPVYYTITDTNGVEVIKIGNVKVIK